VSHAFALAIADQCLRRSQSDDFEDPWAEDEEDGAW
jgi:hypothetical protein